MGQDATTLTGQAREAALEDAYVMHTYGRKPVEFVRGSGMKLWDETGKEYLDFLSGIGTTGLGHCDVAVTAALQHQAETLLHVSNYYYIEGRGELAARLSALLNAYNPDAEPQVWKTFFANSGAEANEGAIKLVRRRAIENGLAGQTIVTLDGSFHGRTLATLAATAQEAKQQAFRPLPAGFVHVPLNDIDALVEALDHPSAGGVCAVMLEVIQGERGVWPCDEAYLEEVRAQTAARGIALICDEVQVGMYRTGRPFAFQYAGIVPDVVTMAKGIANGIPMGAFSAYGDAGSVLTPGDHGSTFGGSCMAVAASNATLERLSAPGFGAHVVEVGDYLAEQLATLPHVSAVRGCGLIRAAQLDMPVAAAAVNAALARGFVLNQVGDAIIRFLPPLIVETADIDALIPVLGAILEEVTQS
jgi:acetylornithine/N-succinyldiaminopimelate aminotransferase